MVVCHKLPTMSSFAGHAAQGASILLAAGEVLPVVGEICKTAQTVLDLIQQAGAVNSTIESVRETVARIDPVLERFQPPAIEGGEPIEVDSTILHNMEDLRKVRGKGV